VKFPIKLDKGYLKVVRGFPVGVSAFQSTSFEECLTSASSVIPRSWSSSTGNFGSRKLVAHLRRQVSAALLAFLSGSAFKDSFYACTLSA
jgi:hypothetical protein